MKGLKKIEKRNKSKYLAADSENEYLKEGIEKLQLELKIERMKLKYLKIESY